MKGYYSETLSADRLKKCYDIAPPRVQQYLEAEINHVIKKIHPGDIVLELGCGYGRILHRLADKANLVIGIDTSHSSLLLGKQLLSGVANCFLLNMDAMQLAFREHTFNRVICIQNGISAFKVDQRPLIQEGVRVTQPGGIVFFSTYSHKFWKERLEWFQLQSEAGLLGEIDWDKTRNGTIVCKDGFTATTVEPHQFQSLTAALHADIHAVEVDESSLFCEIIPH